MARLCRSRWRICGPFLSREEFLENMIIGIHRPSEPFRGVAACDYSIRHYAGQAGSTGGRPFPIVPCANGGANEPQFALPRGIDYIEWIVDAYGLDVNPTFPALRGCRSSRLSSASMVLLRLRPALTGSWIFLCCGAPLEAWQRAGAVPSSVAADCAQDRG